MAVRVAVVVVVWAAFPDVFSGDAFFYWERAREISADHLPYRDFLWEFPPLTIVPALLATVTPGSATAFGVLFGVSMASIEYACLRLVQRVHPREARAIGVYWTAVAVPLSTFVYFRFDWMAVLGAVVAAAGTANVAARWAVPVGIVGGFASKLWPVLAAAPLAASRRWREVVAAALGCAAVVAAWWAFSPAGFADFLAFREGEGFHVESTIGAIAHALGADARLADGALVVDVPGGAALNVVQTAAWVAAGVAMVAFARRRSYDPTRLVGALVVLLLLTSRLFSAQFLVWAVPYVAVTWGQGDRAPGKWFAAAAALTVAYVWAYGAVADGRSLAAAAVVARNAVLVVVAVHLLRGTFRAATPRVSPA